MVNKSRFKTLRGKILEPIVEKCSTRRRINPPEADKVRRCLRALARVLKNYPHPA